MTRLQTLAPIFTWLKSVGPLFLSFSVRLPASIQLDILCSPLGPRVRRTRRRYGDLELGLFLSRFMHATWLLGTIFKQPVLPSKGLCGCTLALQSRQPECYPCFCILISPKMARRKQELHYLTTTSQTSSTSYSASSSSLMLRLQEAIRQFPICRRQCCGKGEPRLPLSILFCFKYLPSGSSVTPLPSCGKCGRVFLT